MDDPKHPNPDLEIAPPPEEKLLPAHAEAGAKNHNKWTLVIGAIILVVILEIASIYFLKTENDVKFIQSIFGTSPTVAPTVVPQPLPTALPTPTYTMPQTSTESGTICPQDAMQCSDGSYVGRTGPECEFVCPQ